MQIIHNMTIDISRNFPVAPVDAVQGDGNTRVLVMTILENDKPWQIPYEAAVDVAFKKKDGTKGIYSKLPDGTDATVWEGNVLRATLAPQMLTCPGPVQVTVVFHVDGGKTLAAFPFTVRVEASPAAGAQISEDYFNPKDLSDLRSEITAVKAYARRVGNLHNLLDNSDFQNPVNQRGLASYKGAGYGIDRWAVSSAAWMVSVEDGYIKISDNPDSASTATGMLRQYVPADSGIKGKKVTLAAKIKGKDVRLNINNKDTSLYSTDDSQWKILIITGTVPADADTFFVALQSRNMATYDCQWIALYEGEYTTETLPEYQPKGYGAELAECQRYYFVVDNVTAAAYTTDDGTAEFFIPTPISIRPDVAPTIAFTNSSIWLYTYGSAHRLTITGAVTVNNGVRVLASTSVTEPLAGVVPRLSGTISTEL